MLEAACVASVSHRPSAGSVTAVTAGVVVNLSQAVCGGLHSTGRLRLLLYAAFGRVAVLLDVDHVESLEHVHLPHIDTD